MRERPIPFSAAMVRALLVGRKTQTRRLAKPQPHSLHILSPSWGTSPDGFEFGERNLWRENGPDYPDGPEDDRRCPYGARGDRLWVRETWGLRRHFDFTDWHRGSLRGVSALPPDWELDYRADWENDESAFWRPSIHMPRWASRLTLEVESVRVERLQDISEEDARAEGMRELPLQEGQPGAWWHDGSRSMHSRTARGAFCSLWASINGPESWDANPWVWVVGFKRAAAAEVAHA